MRYDFTSIIDRRGKDAVAVDEVGATRGIVPSAPKEGFDIIPMWVADMNFPVCPSILEAIQERMTHPIFGYFNARSEYYDGIISWHQNRHGVKELTEECIGYENGVLGGIASALSAFATPGESILVHSPTYNGFTRTLKNGGYNIVHSNLIKDKDGIWRMDYNDMDVKIKQNNIHLAIFCNPHNPCGRVWEAWELKKAMDVYAVNDCIVISDEIWSDIILEGYKHIPMQSISEEAKNRTLAFYAPSKTFNLAGLIGSYHIVYNEELRERLRAAGEKTHYNEMNVLSMYALIGAYKPEGEVWVEELRKVITENIEYGYNYIKEHFDGVEVSKPEGTYMLFADCTKWCEKNNKTIDELEKACWDVGVALQDGRRFNGSCHIRLNMALPFLRIKEAFGRLDKYVFNVKNM